MILELYLFQHRMLATLNRVEPLVLLAVRLHVARVFFLSGLTKIADWDTTLFLFEDEYAVPLLPPGIAAYLATVGELLLPVLLAAGLLTRFSAIGLGIVNVVAVISLTDIAPAALAQHLLWGCLIAVAIVWGGGPLSVDAWLSRNAANRQRGDRAH